MKNLSYIILSLLFLNACSSKEDASPIEEKYPVNFSISTMKQSQSLISSTKTNASKVNASATADPFSYVQSVDLLIYNEKGALVFERTERKSTATSMIEELPVGTYTVIAVGYTNATKDGISSLTTSSLKPKLNDTAGGEIFVDKVQFTVKPIESNHVSLALIRMVGMLKVDILDQRPADVANIRATILDVADTFYLKEMMPRANGVNLTFNDVHAVEQMVGYFMLKDNLQNAYKTVRIEALDAKGAVLKSVDVADVEVGVNIKTSVEGKLFSPGEQGFTIQIDTEWNGERFVEF